MTVYAAHIVTSKAVALGDPEILVMTNDEGMGARLIERVPLERDDRAGRELADRGYAVVPSPTTYVDTGYFIWDVEKD